MMPNANLAKSVADASWNMFVNTTSYKAVEAGSKVVLVNPKGTSQVCSGCGLTVNKTFLERVHRCGCGLVLDCNVNGSVNILRLGPKFFGLKIIAAHPLQGWAYHLKLK